MPGVVFSIVVPTASFEKELKQGHQWNVLDSSNEPALNIENSGRPYFIKNAAIRKNINDPKPNLLIPMEKILEELLRKLDIEQVTWTTDKHGIYHHVIFPLESGQPCETTLHCLTELGIGMKLNSCVSILNCSVSFNALTEEGPVDERETDPAKASKWNNFIESIKSKLTVKQVVDGVRAGGSTSFDYILLIVTADSLAALGLIENNAPNIVAAMLVSPLMGPVMAITFGTIISDQQLIKVGFSTLALGMFISLLFGFIFGLIVGTTDMPWGFTDWPTEEMKGRGNARSLWMGVCWALTSGTGVAVALLQGATGPLIGVAISASLLPPVVNCGLFWGLACIWLIYPGIKMPHIKGEPYSGNSSYEFIYTNYVPTEFFINGIVSGLLTVVNVICIFITAIIVLKIKEVAAPYTASPELRRFWETDIRTVRRTNRSTIRGKHMGGYSNMNLDYSKNQEMRTALQRALNEAANDETFKRVKRMSYSNNAARDVAHNSRLTSAANDSRLLEALQSGKAAILNMDSLALETLASRLLEKQEESGSNANSNILNRRHTFSRSFNSILRRGGRSTGSVESKDLSGIPLTSFMPTIMEQSSPTTLNGNRSSTSSIKSIINSIRNRASLSNDKDEESTNLPQNIVE